MYICSNSDKFVFINAKSEPQNPAKKNQFFNVLDSVLVLYNGIKSADI